MKSLISFLVIQFLIISNLFSQELVNSATFGAMNARQIGSAAMSGRITAIDAVNSDPRIMYVGSAGGGIWKSVNGGAVFKSVFDKYCQSIGALTIDQNNPDVVWAGTGESNMRNSVAIGDGIYKSEDGGDSWKKTGLENSEHISKIVIDSKNSNTVYVSVPGNLWGDSEDRGLYKTIDGGKTWSKILYIDEKTGCADIVMDPSNSKILYASMWQFRRTPWSFNSGGDNSGLYKSVDGGENWDRIDQAFTDDNLLGRICLAISPSDPKHIYAIAESFDTGLFESLDGGKSWTRNSATGNVVARPFYFSVLAVDPTDAKRIYRPAFSLSISDDGGQSFRDISFEGGWVHADFHAIWINPKNPQHIYVGTDGGVYMSLDRGNNFIFLQNLPVSQFYHAACDLDKPYYNVYGGLQDNGSWYAPSFAPGGIQNKDWTSIGFGDGFYVIPDLKDTDYVYWEWQGGQLARYNKKNFENKDIKPQPQKGEGKLRYNWNSPIHQSTLNPGTIYFGSQYLYRTTDKGESWDRISPDLTTDDPVKQTQEISGGLTVDNSSAENHCTIFSICESPADANVIWVGTDDGNLQVSENNGASWTNVIKNVNGVPENTWVSSVDASVFNRNTAFVSFDGHAAGDKKTYIYRTDDLGKTWNSISTKEIEGYVHKIKQDIVNPELLFAGSVFGLYLSIDGGKSWAQYTGNFPKCEIRDIAIQPEKNDLVLASHGRGILIIDDLTPLRNLNKEIIQSEAAILPTRTNLINGIVFLGTSPPEAGTFVGPNPSEDAIIVYYLKDRVMTGDVKVEIYNNEGILLKSIPGTKRKGLNRVSWNMRLKAPKVAAGVTADRSGFIGPLVNEGDYTIKLFLADKIFTGKLEIRNDPNSPYSKDDIALRNEAILKMFYMHESLAYIMHNVDKIKNGTKSYVDSGKIDDTKGNELVNKLEDLRKTCVATTESKGITGEERLRENLSWLYTFVNYNGGRPTQQQLERIEGLEFELDNVQKSADNIYRNYLINLNTELKSKGLKELEQTTKEEFDKTEEKKSM